MCSTIILYFSLIIISSISFLNSSLISPDRQFVPICTVCGLILSYGFLFFMAMLYVNLYYFLLPNLTYSSCYRQSHRFVPICTILLYYLLVTVLVHQQWSLSAICAQIIPYYPVYLFIIDLVCWEWPLSVVCA